MMSIATGAMTYHSQVDGTGFVVGEYVQVRVFPGAVVDVYVVAVVHVDLAVLYFTELWFRTRVPPPMALRGMSK